LQVQQETSTDPTTMGLPNAVAVQNVATWTTYTPVMALNSVVNTTQAISNLQLYINNIFVNPEINCSF